jgi:hypothetical protein
LQWTCERCGLERDDRRGSGCNDVKGQAHEWVETGLYNKRKRQLELESWIASEDSLEWKKEYENIKNILKETVINIQGNYTESFNDSEDKYNKSIEKGKIKYNIWVEYSKKYLEFQEVKIKEAKEKEEAIRKELVKKGNRKFTIFAFIIVIACIIINVITNSIFLPIIIGIILFILGFKISFKRSTFNSNEYVQQALRVFMDNYFNDEERKEIFEFMNGKELEEAWKIYMNKIKREKSSCLKNIEKEYLEKIKNTLQNGIKMIKKNNKKHGVDQDYSYDNYDFSFKDYPTLYEIDSIFSLSLDTIRELRKKYIDDYDFIKKHNIAEYLYS